MTGDHPLRLFISYSHRDEKYLEELRKYLETDRALDIWSDERIRAGDEWRKEICTALANADAALLLVSQDFLNSEFIRNHELPTLLESVRNKSLRLFLIPIGACTWRSAVIERFQWVHDPARPLKALRPALREQALLEISEQIVNELTPQNRNAVPASDLDGLSMATSDVGQALRGVLPSQYEIVREVARGTYATVYEANDQLLGRAVAIKAFQQVELCEDPLLYEYYVRSTAGLKHRNICSVYSVQLQQLPNYVVTEFVMGESLASIIARKGCCALDQALDYFTKIGNALQYAHDRELVHNRLRPAHVVIDAEDHPVISGFHATVRAPSVGRDDRMTLEDQMYMAPEARDGKPVTPAADQYLLGLVLYEMLAGKPFIAAQSWGDLPVQLGRVASLADVTECCDCSTELTNVIKRMLAPAPADRYPSIATAIADAWSISGARLNRRMRADAAMLQAEAARASYRRCLKKADLHEQIYSAFFAACPAAQPLFAKTDLKRQYDLLRHAIVLMLAFHANPTAEEPTILSRVAARHGELGMRIPADWYDAFSKAIQQTVAAADPQFSDSMREAWAAVLENGTRYMRNYTSPARSSSAAATAATALVR
jgi:hemoglobin-like flavoprotein